MICFGGLLMKKRDIILFTAIFCLLSVIVGSTYAYWQWRSADDKTLVFNTSRAIKDYIIYDEGDSHFVGDFQPSDNYCGGMSNTLSFSLNTANMSSQELERLGNGMLVDTIKMDVNFIGSNTSASSAVYWVVTSGESTSCTGNLNNALNYGTFNGVRSGDVITLLSNEEITTSTKTFTVWIWIDSAGSNLSSLSGETIDVNVWSQIDMLDASLNTPNNPDSPDVRAAGLYGADGSFTPWDDLVADGTVTVEDNVVSTQYYFSSGFDFNPSSDALVGVLILPDDGSVTAIGENGFSNCELLTGVVIPANVTSIGNSAFSANYALSSVLFSKNSKLSSIGNSAFYQTALTEIEIPNSVTSLGYGAFSNTNLTSIVIPDTITNYGHGVFSGCPNLTSVTFRAAIDIQFNTGFSSVTELTLGNKVYGISAGDLAGFSNPNLTFITYEGTMDEWNVVIGASSGWYAGTSMREVRCSDGTLTY